LDHVGGEVVEIVGEKRHGNVAGRAGLENTGFPEAEVRVGAAVRVTADDDVVEELDADNVGGLADAAGHAEIGIARSGIAGRVIVDEDETPGGVDEGGTEDISGMGHGFIDGAMGDLLLTNKAEAGIDEQDADGLVREMSHAGSGELIDELGGAERLLDEAFPLSAVTDFKGGREQGGFGGAEGFFRAQKLGGKPGELAEAAVGFDQALSDLDGVFAGDAGVDEQGEQFGVRKRGGAKTQEALPWAVVHG